MIVGASRSLCLFKGRRGPTETLLMQLPLRVLRGAGSRPHDRAGSKAPMHVLVSEALASGAEDALTRYVAVR